MREIGAEVNQYARPAAEWAAGPAHRRHDLRAYVGVASLVALLFALIVYPIGLLLYGSVSKVPPQELVFTWSNLTLETLRVVASSPVMYEAVKNTVIVSVGGTVIALLIAVVLAWTVARTNVPLKGVVGLAAIAPLLVSELVAALAWARLGYSFSGLINIGLADLHAGFVVDFATLPGIAFVMGLYYASYAYLLMIGSLRNLDPSLEEAAAVCGAGTFYTVRRVVWPLISYVVFSVALMVFVTLLSSYPIQWVFGSIANINFVTTHLFRLISTSPVDYRQGAAIGVLLTAVTLVGVLLQGRIFANRRLTTISGRAYQPRMMDVRGWKYPLLGVALLYVFVAMVVPYTVLLLSAFRQVQFFPHFVDFFNPSTLTTQNVVNAFANPAIVLSMRNSLTVGLSVAICGSTLCLVIGYVLERTKLPGRGVIRAISSLPLAIPGLIIGVGFLWAWIGLPMLYGTLAILVLAFVARYVPDGLQPISATLRQVHEELEEAAWVCGASWLKTARTILVPLIRSGMASVVILLFIYSVRQLGPVLFLTNNETQVMAVTVLDRWSQGDVAGATVVALLQSGILLIAFLVARLVFRVKITP